MKRLTSLFFILAATVTLSYAQVGINNSNPHPSSVLDMSGDSNTTRGMLIPSTSDKGLIVQPRQNGLLIFDNTDSSFYYWKDNGTGEWQNVSPWNSVSESGLISTNKKVAIGKGTATTSLDVAGTTKTDTLESTVTNSNKTNTTTLSVPGFSDNALVPTGAIIMWSGTIPPSGWAICDGTNGTPNLRGRFIVGQSNFTAYHSIGATGGQEFVTLTTNEMPSHNHTGTTDHEPDHTHTISVKAGDGTSPNSHLKESNNNSPRNATDVASSLPAGGHNHNLNINNTGGDAPHENRPPYYVLAYIIKL